MSAQSTSSHQNETETKGPLHKITDDPRSLDTFLTLARDASLGQKPWRYWLIFLSLGVANSSDAAEILCLSYILSDHQFQESILGESSWRAGLLAAAVFAGMLVGGLLVGALGDSRGRRPILLTGLVLNATAGVFSSLAPDVWALSLLRLVAGVGIGATVPPLFTLCSELAPPSDRGFWVAVAASFWMVGSLYVAGIGWMLLGHGIGWRWFAASCALPSALGAVMVLSDVPESPRFLALEGDTDRATEVANQLASAMDFAGSPLMRDEVLHHYPPSEETHLRAARSTLQEFVYATEQLYTSDLRPTTLALQTVWFSLSFGSYGLLTWINTLFEAVHLENIYTNALLFALSNLPGNLLSALLMDRTGRSSMLVGSVLAAAASLLAFAYVAAKEDVSHHGAIIVGAACAFQCFIIAAWNAIDVLTSELFPTTSRSTGMGLCAASGRIGAMLAQFVNGLLIGRPVRLLLVAAGSLLLGALTPAWLPEDRTGRPVEDRVSHRWSETSGGLSMPEFTDDEHIGSVGSRRHPYQPIRVYQSAV